MSVVGRVDDEAGVLQIAGDDFSDRRVVIDDKYPTRWFRLHAVSLARRSGRRDGAPAITGRERTMSRRGSRLVWSGTSA
ncbi:hypothetical protein VR46_42805 [Streptomyces sp. NRRL S-444]|nr:hypothetical protein VR46_42805 [Streptomyces sp. NRRL S-444]